MTSIAPDDALAIVPHRVASYSKAEDSTLRRAQFRDVSENLAAHVAVAVMCNMDGAAVRETLARKIGEIAAQE